MNADFTQKQGGWGKNMNFDSKMGDGNPNNPNSAYDLNGNIKQMQQWGWTPQNAAMQIDSLTYSYLNNSTKSQTFSNKLQAVHDPITVSGLGDFENRHTGTIDYAYDANGNLMRDLNKRIGASTSNGMTYNHLNLPTAITIRNENGTFKGKITYTYDAGGNKLNKVVIENNVPVVYNNTSYTVNVTTTTLYRSGSVYESKTYSNSILNPIRYFNQLQFLGHEEGRVRAVRPTPQSNAPITLVYDYMLKDHLGNVRMVLTEQKDTTFYPILSFEGTSGTAAVNDQNAVWENATGQSINVTAVRTTSPGVLQNSGLQPPPLTNALLVRSSTGKVGAGKLIKVMAGDRVNTSVQYYYPTVGTQPTGNGLNSLLGGLASLISNSAGAGGLLKTASTTLANGVGVDPLVVAFFNTQNNNPAPGKPKAYLNVLFFDEQFKMDANASLFRQVGTGSMNPNNPGQIGFMAGSAALAKKSGYCYIYISNESDDMVYFDNFTLSHERSSLIEETHYYPFGLTMAGISSKAAGKGLDCGCGNKKGYNGNEIQAKEFSDGSGLDVYDFNARTYDQQIGRFIQIDPLTEEAGQDALTPYHFSGNNPSTFNDPDGKCPWCWGAIIGAVVEYGTQVGVNLAQGKSVKESLTNVDGNAILISAGAGALSGGTSAFIPKTTGAKVLVQSGKIAIDAGESALQQYNENGSVSFNQTVTDVGTNKVAGKLTENVTVHSTATIKTTEKQLDRAQRIATGDPKSSGRAATVQKLDNKVTNQKAANAGAQQAAEGALSNGMQATGDALLGGNGKPNSSSPRLVQPPKLDLAPKDNTNQFIRRPSGF
jgi:RHS repeat-associated protein